MKENKKPIHPLTWIIVAAIFITGALGFQFYQNFQKQKLRQNKKNAEQQAQVAAQKEAADKSRDQQIKDLEDQVSALKNKPAETIPVPEVAPDKTSDIIKEWSPLVAYVECEWADIYGAVRARAWGSGTLINYKEGMSIATNKHVLFDQDKYAPMDCTIKFPGVKSYYMPWVPDTYIMFLEHDFGVAKMIQDPVLNSIAKQEIKLCPNVNVGDELLILGYPAIGSPTGITVTEGIVSGYDGDYYVTSAKIDHGNSGGAAILVKDDCYLGIPSAAKVGTIESLGRILKADFVIK
jgi:hypothetical protein